MKIGASSAHLAMACGMMMLTTAVIAIAASSSHTPPTLEFSMVSPSQAAATSGILE